MITDQKAAPAAQPPATEPSEETLRAIEKVLLDGKNSDVPEYWKGVARPLALKLYEAAQPPAIGAASSDLLEYYWQLKRTEIIEAVERAGFRIVSRLGSVSLEPIAAAPTIATPPEATVAVEREVSPSEFGEAGVQAALRQLDAERDKTVAPAAPTDDARAAVDTRLPRLTPAMIAAAAEAHYGKKRVRAAGGAQGISMTVDGYDYGFDAAFRRMWRGVRGCLAASPAADTEGGS